MVKYTAVAVAVALTVTGGGVGAVAVAGLTKRFFNHIQKDVLINVWGYPGCWETSLCYAVCMDRHFVLLMIHRLWVLTICILIG